MKWNNKKLYEILNEFEMESNTPQRDTHCHKAFPYFSFDKNIPTFPNSDTADQIIQ